MILLLRGHIRNSFENRDLYHLLKELDKIRPLKIYIHTWCFYSNSLSWRKVDENNSIVTEDLIYEYFDDLKPKIKKIIITDDRTIQLIGKTEGRVGKSLMPLKGWKNYWYGQFLIMNEIYTQEKEHLHQKVLNTRFDVLSNSISFSKETIKHFVQYNFFRPIDRNKFIAPVLGLDNAIMGNVDMMFKLIVSLYSQLDIIVKMYPEFNHHEQLVHFTNEFLFKKDRKRLYFS